MSGRFSLCGAPLDPVALSRAMQQPQAGALVTFEGWVRSVNGGRAVSALEYEAYEAVACTQGDRILDEALRRFDALAVRCVHRVGRLAVGEAAVWIGVAAAHREAAFAACAYVIDEVKRRVPIWKKEHYADGTSEWTAPAGAGPAPR